MLESMLDPGARAIANTQEDDEPLSQEDCEALDRAEEWLKHNDGIPHEEILAEFGLTIDDFPLRPSGSPNQETIAAMREANAGEGLREYRSFRELRERT